MTSKRVVVFGGAGSGKTTLAAAFAAHRELPHYELDHFFWADAPTRQKREEADRDELLQDAVAGDTWVIDGIFWQDWVRPAVRRADKVVVLSISEWRRHTRVVKRHLQLLKRASPSAYPTFLPTLFELLKLNRGYEKEPMQRTLLLAASGEGEVVVCRSNDEARHALGL